MFFGDYTEGVYMGLGGGGGGGGGARVVWFIPSSLSSYLVILLQCHSNTIQLL